MPPSLLHFLAHALPQTALIQSRIIPLLMNGSMVDRGEMVTPKKLDMIVELVMT